MSIYLIGIIGALNGVMLLKYLIDGVYSKQKNNNKEQICIKFLESLKE